MVTQIVVELQARSAKIKCGPSTLLREIRSKASEIFGIQETNFILKHKNTVMDLSLPLRLTSLVQNSKLELVVASAKAKAQEAKVTDVAIKLQVEDLAPSFSAKLLHSFPSNTTLWQVLVHFERVSGINFTKRAIMHQVTPSSGHLVFEAPVIQSFNKRISTLEEYAKSLIQLGLNNRQETLRVRFEKTDLMFQDIIDQQEVLFGKAAIVPEKTLPSPQLKSPQPEPIPTEIDSEQKPVESTVEESESTSIESTPSEPQTSFPEPDHESGNRAVKVYLPSQTQRVIKDDDDSSFVVSLSHAQKLQDQIHRNSKPSEGPLLTKSLRQKLEQDKTESIKTIQIRIRFPDQTHLEASFKASETIGDVIEFVKSSLSQPDLPFRLFTNPPKQFYTDLQAQLVRTCKFSPRTLLFFEWNHESGLPKNKFPQTGIIKKEMLTDGKSITEAPDVKLDMTGSNNGDGEVEKEKKTSWLSKGKGPLSLDQKSKLMKFIKTSKK